jgi:glycosyltransferase involved in cell wall biosynthesis
LTTPRVSVIIPVYNEGNAVIPVFERIKESIGIPFEVLAVYDSETDSTLPALLRMSQDDPRFRPVLNGLGPGPANAIRYGMHSATAPTIVVTMADGCDDAVQIVELTRLVERGVVVACASRYTRGGQQVGGPLLKGMISRIAGVSLYWLARVGTRDATNSFKAYSASFLKIANVESNLGFEIGIELVAKARRFRLPVAEIPTTWLDRTFGVSNFRLWAWAPRYLKWYLYAFGWPKKSTK